MLQSFSLSFWLPPGVAVSEEKNRMIQALYNLYLAVVRFVNFVINFFAVIGFAVVASHFWPYLPAAWEVTDFIFSNIQSIFEVLDKLVEIAEALNFYVHHKFFRAEYRVVLARQLSYSVNGTVCAVP